MQRVRGMRLGSLEEIKRSSVWLKHDGRRDGEKLQRKGQKNITICVKTHGLYTGVTGET